MSNSVWSQLKHANEYQENNKPSYSWEMLNWLKQQKYKLEKVKDGDYLCSRQKHIWVFGAHSRLL